MLKKFSIHYMFVILFFSGLSGFVNAQEKEACTLTGTVFVGDNQLIPGMQVKLESPVLRAPLIALSNEKGVFTFSELPPGIYTATFKLEGFKTKRMKNINVKPQDNLNLLVEIELGKLKEDIVLIDSLPILNTNETTLITRISSFLIANIPSNRDLSYYIHMTPGITEDTVHGSSVRDNLFTLDGLNITDPVSGTQAGLFSMDAVEEVSVQTGGHPAQDGGVQGGVINIVTGSGGNRFHGMASFYYRDDNLQADNNKGTIWEGLKTGIRKEIEPSFSLCGPINRNKAWFFVNFNQRNTNRFVPGFPYNDPGSITPLTKIPMLFGKITVQLGQNDKLTASYNYSNLKNDNRNASEAHFMLTTWDQDAPKRNYSLQLFHLFSNNFIMNLRAGYMDYHLNFRAKTQLPNIYDYYYGHNYGGYCYDSLYTRNRFQIQGDAATFIENVLGNHELRFGIDFQYSKDLREDSYYRDDLGGSFYSSYNGYLYEVQFQQDYSRKEKKIDISGFISDQWDPTDRLVLNLGLRFDHQEGIIPKQGENRVSVFGFNPQVEKQFTAFKLNNIAPRLGISYVLTNDWKTVLKVTANRYYSSIPIQYFTSANPNNALSWKYSLDGTMKILPGTLYGISYAGGSTVGPDLKTPYTDEISFGIERELNRDMKVSARYILKWEKNLIEDVDLAVLDYEKLKAGEPLDTLWKNYVKILRYDSFDGNPYTFYQQLYSYTPNILITNPPGARRSYNGLEIELEKRFSNKWGMNASYLYSRSKGLIGTDYNESWSGQDYFNDPNAHINAYGTLESQRRNQLKVQVIYQAPLGINIGTYFRYLSGLPWTRMIGTSDGIWDEATINHFIYAEPRGSHHLPDLAILDLRIGKSITLPRHLGCLSVFVDIFNALNAKTATSVWNYSSRNTIINGHIVQYGEKTSMLSSRSFRLGARFEF